MNYYRIIGGKDGKIIVALVVATTEELALEKFLKESIGYMILSCEITDYDFVIL